MKLKVIMKKDTKRAELVNKILCVSISDQSLGKKERNVKSVIEA